MSDDDNRPTSRSESFRLINKDRIAPVCIVHECDELCFGDRLGQHYNFLVYVFENDRASIRARSYLDDIESVTVYPAHLKNSDDGSATEIAAPELRAAAVAYLRRRYQRIKPDDLPEKKR